MTKSEEDAFVNEYADGLRAAIRQVRNILDEENAGEGKEWESGPVEQVPMAGDNERLAAVGFQPRLEQVQASIQGAPVGVQSAVAVQVPSRVPSRVPSSRRTSTKCRQPANRSSTRSLDAR